MPRVKIDANTRTFDLDARPGQSVMEVAVRSGVPGIIGECGGTATCATCHVYVDPAFASRVGPPDGAEDEMLEEVLGSREPTSRLSCQITVDDDLDGLSVKVPEVGP